MDTSETMLSEKSQLQHNITGTINVNFKNTTIGILGWRPIHMKYNSKIHGYEENTLPSWLSLLLGMTVGENKCDVEHSTVSVIFLFSKKKF